jgi:hypothetical protein
MPKPRIQIEIDPGPLKNLQLEFLRRYWLDKRGDHALPSRADMVPSELKPVLDGLIMIDVLPDLAEFRYRLVGTAVTQYFLTDPTGKTTQEAWAPVGPRFADRIRNNLRAIARERVCVHAWGAVDWMGSGDEAFECLYLPLSDDGETVNMIINLFTFDRRRVLLDRQISRDHGRSASTV